MSLLPTTLCVIPCRLGSKGIPRKNLREVAERTLLDRALDFAESVSTHVIVSTESEEILQVLDTRSFAPMIDFVQPPKYHGDESRAIDVWRHAWMEAEKQAGHFYATSLYLEPSSPLREPWMAEKAIDALTDFSAAWTVEPVPVRYANMKQFGMAKDVLHAVEGADTMSPRQRLPARYIRNGAIYALKRVWMVSARSAVFAPLSTYPILTEPLVNIDDEADLAEAERRLALIETSTKEPQHGQEARG